ncbi:hypothetical protein AGRO_0903 [Agrobacterium sp. ATCC 31749]|nr:hypothetical protein AGRO_0903 [Agrobacterium sp. ATCC 31749]
MAQNKESDPAAPDMLIG